MFWVIVVCYNFWVYFALLLPILFFSAQYTFPSQHGETTRKFSLWLDYLWNLTVTMILQHVVLTSKVETILYMSLFIVCVSCIMINRLEFACWKSDWDLFYLYHSFHHDWIVSANRLVGRPWFCPSWCYCAPPCMCSQPHWCGSHSSAVGTNQAAAEI